MVTDVFLYSKYIFVIYKPRYLFIFVENVWTNFLKSFSWLTKQQHETIR